MTIKFTVPAKPFMAAMLYQSKKYVRYYLSGVMIEKSCIVATNGYTLFMHECDAMHDYDSGFIVDVIGKMPAKSKTARFELDQESKSGIVYCIDAIGNIISAFYVKIISGDTYPKWRNVFKPNESEPTEKIGINAKYLDQLNKAAKLVGCFSFPVVEMKLNGDNNSVVFNINGPEYKSTVLIMPSRL
jgi:hypothetical protein